MRRLVASWIEAERSRGLTTASAIRELNEATGLRVTHSRVSEWRRGRYVPSPAAISYMLSRVLPWALRRAGIRCDEDCYDQLEALIWRPCGDSSEDLYLL